MDPVDINCSTVTERPRVPLQMGMRHLRRWTLLTFHCEPVKEQQDLRGLQARGGRIGGSMQCRILIARQNRM